MFDITITRNAAESSLVIKEAWYREERKYEFGKDDAIVIYNERLGISRRIGAGGEIYLCDEGKEDSEWEYLTFTGNNVFINGGKIWFAECKDMDGKLRISLLWNAIEVDENHKPKSWTDDYPFVG